MLRENLESVEAKIQAACDRVGRKRDEVTLIAVSKTKPVSMLKEAYDLGVRIFGENKVQEIRDKYEVLPKDIEWHMIGHLQTNKVKYIVDKVALIPSVDSAHLAKQIDKEAAKRQMKEVPVLIQVNFAHEDTKFGLAPEETEDVIREIASMEHVKVKGLMQIAPFVDDPEENRKYFRAMKQLSVDIENKKIDNVDMSILSMGMTNDYEVAVEEGATMIRVGTGIFGERNYSI